MNTPDEQPQNPILHLITFSENVSVFMDDMLAEPEEWRVHCRNLQDAWETLSNVDIQRLPLEALNRIRSFDENQNRTHKHDGRGAPSAYDLAIILWTDFRQTKTIFTHSFQWSLEHNQMIRKEDWAALSRRYDTAELQRIGLLVDSEFKYASRRYCIDTLPLLQREIFNQLSEDGEATRAELRAALQEKIETGEINGSIATSDKPIRDAVKTLLNLKLIRDLQGLLQINS